jgi:hypothetical protein
MRHIPLLAFCACATVLLVGCDYPTAPVHPTPDQPLPPVSVEIYGPLRVDSNGVYTWGAIAFCGSGTYHYQWEVTSQAGTQPTRATQQQVEFSVAQADGDIGLKLTVRSGDQGETSSRVVRNCIATACQ